ncbi:centrosomal protein of 76 kDa isoform X2 [Periophthalmus magnuspinnatus]|uniref:centrosomal protein of 76 kDa isoform X2 n=1 Tax=Periophthalmus magnuspinnatus TaxID=409849 RepID=UPI00243680A1|nr:centrosomal protein of 76 kDa isoform X2 [Periophthalmus magnuspinnatus]
MSLPPEKAPELKQIIHNHLMKINIHGKIREVLAETVREDSGITNQPLSEKDFLHALQRRGIIDSVMKDLHFTQQRAAEVETQSPSRPATHFIDKDEMQLSKTNIDPCRRYLYLQIQGGKAFLEHLQEPEPLPGQVCSTFTLYLHFRNQRFRSKPVPCACEPDIKEGFLLEVHKDDLGSECKVPAGILTVSLELYPPLTETISPDIISTQQSLERQRNAEKERLFLVYAKQWWREFLEIRPTHQSKMVKIFAQDENCVNRPVCSYVRVLRAGRLLESPRQAARFVSLLAHEKAPVVGSGAGKHEQWCTLLAFLCRGKGDCEDHATLLCSLLLGFGQDAYVCVGTKTKGVPHTWVLTRGTDGSVTFWESLTAHRYLHQAIDPDAPPLVQQPKPSHPYRTVGCVFNHQSFLANCQPSDAVELCVFDFQNQSRWKAMSEEALKSVCFPGSSTSLPPVPPLTAPTLDSAVVSNQLELEMRYLISEHRKDLDLATVWDDHLSYLLSSALSAYELERCTGVSCGNEEFQDAVRRAVPDGHTFKGFPIHFLHRNARRAFATSLRSPFCDEIICCRGDHVRLAVRVRVFVYPENACAVWIMFACKYRSVL